MAKYKLLTRKFRRLAPNGDVERFNIGDVIEPTASELAGFGDQMELIVEKSKKKPPEPPKPEEVVESAAPETPAEPEAEETKPEEPSPETPGPDEPAINMEGERQEPQE